MTHGHELTRVGGGLLEGRVVSGGRMKGENWDNCKSIINKICLKMGLSYYY